MPILDSFIDDPSRTVTVTADPLALAERRLDLSAEYNAGGNRSILVGGGVSASRTAIGLPSTQDKLRPWGARVGVRQYVLGTFDTGLGVGADAGWAGYGPVRQRTGHPVASAYLVAKASLAIFAVEARVGAEAGGTLKDISFAPVYGVGVGLGF